jgi:hypothetical protein
MARSYYSTVFEQPADAVWRAIRDFNNYPVWVDGAGTSHIEDGKSGESVGAIGLRPLGIRQCQQTLAPPHVLVEHVATSSPAIRRYRCRISRPPSASRRSSIATAPSSNGGRASIASLSTARSGWRSSTTRLPDGSARSGGISSGGRTPHDVIHVEYVAKAAVPARARWSVLTLTSATEPRSTSRCARSSAGRMSPGFSTNSP